MRQDWNSFHRTLVAQPWHEFYWRGNRPRVVRGSTLTVYPYHDRFRFHLVTNDGYLYKGDFHRRNPRFAFNSSIEGMFTSVFENIRVSGCLHHVYYGPNFHSHCFQAAHLPAGNPKVFGSLATQEDLGQVITLRITNAPREVWGFPPEKLEFMTSAEALKLMAD